MKYRETTQLVALAFETSIVARGVKHRAAATAFPAVALCRYIAPSVWRGKPFAVLNKREFDEKL